VKLNYIPSIICLFAFALIHKILFQEENIFLFWQR
jgi:hypothetical protein